MLTLVYALGAALLLLGWKGWKRIIALMPLDQRLVYFLKAVYWCIFISLLSGVLGAVKVWNYDPKDSMDKFILFALAFGLIVQAAAFAFVFTPVVMEFKKQKAGFYKYLIATECWVVLPTALFIGLNLWLFGTRL